jgi:hypothetical protein
MPRAVVQDALLPRLPFTRGVHDDELTGHRREEALAL